MTNTTIALEHVLERLHPPKPKQEKAKSGAAYEGLYVDDLAEFMKSTADEDKPKTTSAPTVAGVMMAAAAGIYAFGGNELVNLVTKLLH